MKDVLHVGDARTDALGDGLGCIASEDYLFLGVLKQQLDGLWVQILHLVNDQVVKSALRNTVNGVVFPLTTFLTITLVSLLLDDVVHDVEEVEGAHIQLPLLVLEEDVVNCALLFATEDFVTVMNVIDSRQVSLDHLAMQTTLDN